jgi:hypothetical protein
MEKGHLESVNPEISIVEFHRIWANTTSAACPTGKLGRMPAKSASAEVSNIS